MNKTGRNDPCPCGSGNKYKRCCLPKDQAADRAALAAAAELRAAEQEEFEALLDEDEIELEYEEKLTESSNAVVDLIHAGKLDEAEQAARDLRVNFPDELDGYDRLGMVYEARGDHKQAADCYRQVLEFLRSHPDHAPQLETAVQQLIQKLDPPAGD
jgi:tetratricopeptide (TPR) repeat protein